LVPVISSPETSTPQAAASSKKPVKSQPPEASNSQMSELRPVKFPLRAAHTVFQPRSTLCAKGLLQKRIVLNSVIKLSIPGVIGTSMSIVWRGSCTVVTATRHPTTKAALIRPRRPSRRRWRGRCPRGSSRRCCTTGMPCRGHCSSRWCRGSICTGISDVSRDSERHR